DRAALRGRVDARDDASDDAVARVDLRGKANREVTRLRFRDLQFGLQFGRVRHAGDVRAGRQLLADFDRQFLQLALHRRPDGEVAELALTQLVLGAQAVDFGQLRRDVRIDVLLRDAQPLFGDGELVLQLRLGRFELLQLKGAHQTVFRQLAIGFERQGGLTVLRPDADDLGFLAQELAFEVRPRVFEIGFRRLQGQTGLRHLLFELRIRHFDDDGAGTDLRARSEDDALDTAGGRGR